MSGLTPAQIGAFQVHAREVAFAQLGSHQAGRREVALRQSSADEDCLLQEQLLEILPAQYLALLQPFEYLG